MILDEYWQYKYENKGYGIMPFEIETQGAVLKTRFSSRKELSDFIMENRNKAKKYTKLDFYGRKKE